MGQRPVYFRTTSCISASVVAASRVHNNQCRASHAGAGLGSHTSTSVHVRGQGWGYFTRSSWSVVGKARIATVAVRAGCPCARGTGIVTRAQHRLRPHGGMRQPQQRVHPAVLHAPDDRTIPYVLHPLEHLI